MAVHVSGGAGNFSRSFPDKGNTVDYVSRARQARVASFQARTRAVLTRSRTDVNVEIQIIEDVC